MSLPGLKTLRLSARWLRSRAGGGALILGYHRVAEPVWDPFELCVAPHHFAQQLDVLRRLANPIALPALVRALDERRVPPRAVAVTFDDGYADVLGRAKPLLARYRVPATAFVATGNLGGPFWWDELERLLRPPAPLPSRLALPLGGAPFEWPPARPPRGDPRSALLLALCDRLRPLPQEERRQAMERIRARLARPDAPAPEQRAMTEGEVAALGADRLVTIGSHTVTHPELATLSPTAQRREVVDSKARLEAIVGRPVTSLSYPNGSASAQTPAILRETGLTCACASHWDVARPGGDRFRLPRFWVPDVDGAAFERWLRRWLCGPAAEATA